MKRHLRFSLRGLLICVTAICLWLGYRLSAIHREESAVHAIKQTNGWVEYGCPRGFHGLLAFGEYRHRSKWKRVLIGDGPYDAVGAVHLEDGISRHVDCDDALLAELLPHLKRLRALNP